jgi:hypothetical protein
VTGVQLGETVSDVNMVEDHPNVSSVNRFAKLVGQLVLIVR